MNTYLGIDVSKGYADFTLLNQDKKPVDEVFQLDDTREGHQRLEKYLSKQIAQRKISTVYCGVESTGGFENNWYASLIALSKKLPLKVARLNPYGVKNHISAGLNRNVTDALSSQYIAEYLIAYADKVSYEEQNNRYASFRNLHTHTMLQIKQCTQLINELKANLYSAFPDMMRYCKNGVPQWVLNLLQRYPTAASVACVKPSQLTKLSYVNEEKAQTIIAKAKSSVASRTDVNMSFLIKSLVGEISHKQQCIVELKEHLTSHCQGPETALLMSLSGIGEYSASAIMIEIEDIKRFSTPKRIASFFGVHPVLKESGDKSSPYRMSKRGSATMRAILYMCANNVVLHDPHFKEIYHHHRKKGMKHKQAIGAIMHKLLRVMWGMLTHHCPYDSNVDKRNQERKIFSVNESKKIGELKAKRRYQEVEINAPITRCQNKIRKGYLKSQAGLSPDNNRIIQIPQTV